MKKLFTKFLLLAAVAIVSAACNKDNNDGPENYMQIGDQISAISGCADSGLSGRLAAFYVTIFSEGITYDEADGRPQGAGNAVNLYLSPQQGTFTFSGQPESLPSGDYLLNFRTSDGESEEEGDLLVGTKITWSKSGNVISIDIEGTCRADVTGATAKPFKLHYQGVSLPMPN